MPRYVDGANSQIFVQHESTSVPIGKLQSLDYTTDVSLRLRGAGLGAPAHDDVATGERTGSLSATRKVMRLTGYSTADLFTRLISGSAMEIREPTAAAATTHTTSEDIVGIISITLATSGVMLVEGEDFGVNFVSNVVSFYVSGGLPEAADVIYVTDAIRGYNVLENYVFDLAIADFWSGVATGTVTRNITAADVYVGTGSLQVVPTAANDGAEYTRQPNVYPGRAYELRFAIKGVTLETFDAIWEDSSGTVSMTWQGTCGTKTGTDWEIWKAQVTPDEAGVVSVQVINTFATTPGTFFLDHVTVSELAPKVSPLSERAKPYRCNVQVRDLDGAQLFRLLGVHLGSRGVSIGDVNSDAEESLDGFFLDFEGEV